MSSSFFTFTSLSRSRYKEHWHNSLYLYQSKPFCSGNTKLKVCIRYLFWFPLRYKVCEDIGTVLPWPTRILSFIQLFLIGVNLTKSATCLSDLVTHMDQHFAPGTRLDHMFVRVTTHRIYEFVSRAVSSRSTYAQSML